MEHVWNDIRLIVQEEGCMVREILKGGCSDTGEGSHGGGWIVNISQCVDRKVEILLIVGVMF